MSEWAIHCTDLRPTHITHIPRVFILQTVKDPRGKPLKIMPSNIISSCNLCPCNQHNPEYDYSTCGLDELPGYSSPIELGYRGKIRALTPGEVYANESVPIHRFHITCPLPEVDQ